VGFRVLKAEPGLRARQKKKQQMRRMTIIITIVIIAASLAIGIYFVATANGASVLDKQIGQPVSSTDMTSLQSAGAQPYGPAPTSSMQSDVDKYGSTPFISNGKPVVLYVGAEYCPYCAVERWAMIMALERFGIFTNLHYTTSANDEGDFATFTFVGSSYTSNYIAFRPYEEEDRAQNPLQTVPSNYSKVWTSFGGGFPFVDFGNTYVLKGSLLPDAGILTGENWTTILNDISISDSTGVQIREAANLITAVICKVTQGAPVAVCSAPPINTETSAISGPAQMTLSIGSAPSIAQVLTPSWPPGSKRFG
jgi:hypothetical protein